MFCKFCNRECFKKRSLSMHQTCCKMNPDRVVCKNQYIKAVELGKNYQPTASELQSWQDAGKRAKEKIWTKEDRENRSVQMKEIVRLYPESYTSSNRGRTKQILFDGEKFQGNWELWFYKWCKENKILVERNKKCFSYEYNGSRSYFPDFYLPELKYYVEIKGYQTEKDTAKWDQFPDQIKVLKEKSLNEIKRNTFDLNSVSFYGTLAQW